MTVDYVKYVIKKCLLSTYTCAVVDIEKKELINDIGSLICNCTRFKNCDKILVCTKISEGNFVVEKYPFENEEIDDQDDVFKVIIKYIVNKYSCQRGNLSIIYGSKSKIVKIINGAEFLNMENGKKLKVITTVGRMESGQIKFGQISVEKGK